MASDDTFRLRVNTAMSDIFNNSWYQFSSHEWPPVKRIIRGLIILLSIITVAWHLFYAWQSPMVRVKHSNIHLGLFLVIFYFTTIKFNTNSWRDYLNNILTVIFIVGISIVTLYVHFNFERLLGPVSQLLLYTQTDLVIGALVMMIALHATWRAYGATLGLVVLFSIMYGYFGEYFPGLLQHGGISLEQLIFINSISLSGVYGFILGVGSTWVVIFILFAGFIEGYGGIDFLIKRANSLSGKIRSGVVQTGVVSSMLVGSIMGSSAANVATTGSFTIPLMKDQGVESENAAAIESIASTAGQMLPPVMGSAAFLMADILGIPFFAVIQGATIPALLFYFTTSVIVYLLALKHDWGGTESDLSEETTPQSHSPTKSFNKRVRSLGATLVTGSPYIISFLTLVYLLAVLRFSPLTAGLYSIVILPPLALVRDLGTNGLSTNTVIQWGQNTISSCRIGSENMAPLTAVLASLGIVVRIITQTGLAQRISIEINALAGSSLILVLLAAMAISVLFGMGMPTAAAYIVVAVLTAPTLIAVGIGELTAHIFVFYFALLSTITPPVALSCAVGAGIAEAKFWDVAVQTLRLGLFTFLLPFIFVMNEELVLWTSATPITVFAVCMGLVSTAFALVGFDAYGSLAIWKRISYFVLAAIIFFVPLAQVPLSALMLLWILFSLWSNQQIPSSIIEIVNKI